MPLFLAGPLSPRQAWFTLKAQIDMDNNAVTCSPLVDYLRASLTLTTVNVLPALALAANTVAPSQIFQDIKEQPNAVQFNTTPVKNNRDHEIKPTLSIKPKFKIA